MDAIKISGGGNKMTIYDTHIEIERGFFPYKKNSVIPMSAIASVDKPQFLNQVVITTFAGIKYKFSIGSASKIQKAILERMARR